MKRTAILDTSKNLLRDSIAALRGTRPLAYPSDMSRELRSGRLALKPLATVFRGALLMVAGLSLSASAWAVDAGAVLGGALGGGAGAAIGHKTGGQGGAIIGGALGGAAGAAIGGRSAPPPAAAPQPARRGESDDGEREHEHRHHHEED